MIEKLRLNIQRFGASNYNSTTLSSGAGNKATLATSFVENSTTVETNKSNITITGSLTMTVGSFSVSSNPTLYIYWHDDNTNTDIYVNSKVIQSLSRGNSSSVSGTIDVTHKSDGSLNGYSFSIWSYSGSTTYVPANGTIVTPLTALTTIPRASSVSATETEIGAKPTFTITRAVDTFTHTLKYSFGSLSGTIATNVGTSYNNWTIPTTFYNEIPNSPSGSATITCETYNGSTLIGTSTTTLTVNVPSSAKPNVSTPTIVDTDPISRDTIQAYVVGKSKLKFTFPEFSTDYGSTLGSYTLIINDRQVYSGSAPSYTMPTTISHSGNDYRLIITDSRGISNTTGEVSFTAYTYSAPTCSITAERNSTTATTVNITYSGAITNINNNNKNEKSFNIQYRLSGSSDAWTTLNNFPVEDAYTKSNVSVNALNISDSNTFDFRITATDSYGITTATVQVPTSATLLNFNANGATMAFGKASEINDTIEVNIKSKFLKEVNLPAIANVKSNGTALTTTIQNAIQNSIKTATLKATYPVGAIYKTTSSTNPATTFGFGTWTQTECHEIIKSGDITSSGLLYCKYRIFANGTFEVEGVSNYYDLGGSSGHTLSFTFPYTISGMVGVSGLNNGGANFANVQSYCNANGKTITVYTWNWGGATANSLSDSFICKGIVDLNSVGLSTLYSWKRTA